MNKNILFFTGRLTGGGAEKQFSLWVKSISENIPDIKIYVTVLNTSASDYKIINYDSVKFISLFKKRGKLYNLKVLWDLYKIVREEKISHFVAFLGVPTFIASIICLFTKVKLISSIRSGVNINTALWSKKKLFKKVSFLEYFFKYSTMHAKLWIPLSNFIFWQSSSVVFNSKRSMLGCKKIILPKFHSKSICMYNILQNKDNLIPPTKVKNFLRRPLQIVIASRIVPEKGIVEFINEMQELNKKNKNLFTLDIFGSGDESYIQKIKSLASPQTRLFPFDKNIPKKFQKYNFFAYPTKWSEGLPNAVLEGFLCGCVPIISFQADPDNIYTHEFNALKFSPDNPQEIQNVLRQAFKNYKNLRNNVMNSRKDLIKKFHSPKSFSKKFIRLINKN